MAALPTRHGRRFATNHAARVASTKRAIETQEIVCRVCPMCLEAAAKSIAYVVRVDAMPVAAQASVRRVSLANTVTALAVQTALSAIGSWAVLPV